MRKIRIIINNDNGRRDLLALTLLKYELIKAGFKVLLASRDELESKIRYYQPDIILAARGDNPIFQKYSNKSFIYVLPGEGGRQTKETMLSVFLGRGYSKLESVSWIKKCFLWNHNTYEWLVQDGFLKHEQLEVVGNIRTDIYNLKELFNHKKEKFIIGIAFSATSTSAYYGNSNFAEVYHDSIRKDYFFPIAGKDRHFEDIIWRDHAILRTFIHLIKDIYERNPDSIIYFRPNPLESISTYKFLENKYKGKFFIKDNQTLPQFLDEISILLTCWSTTGLESFILKKPVISISNTINQVRLFDHINLDASGFNTFVKFFHLPNTTDEIFNLIEDARNNLLNPSPKSELEIEELLKKNFDFPKDITAISRIVDILKKDSKSIIPQNISYISYLFFGFKTLLIIIRRYLRAISTSDPKSYLAFYNNNSKNIQKFLSKKFND